MEKNYIRKALFPLLLITCVHVRAQVGIGTATPNAALDVVSTDSGVLVPRVALTSTSTIAPITAGTVSELVYNTATINDVTPGFYYLGSASGPWIRLSTGTETTSRWGLTGNAGTNPTSNFIGTTDSQDLSIRTSGSEKIRVTAAGNMGIGAPAPEEKLQINNGNIFLNNATAGQHIRWTSANAVKPSFGTRSAGTRLVLWPGITSAQMDFASGVEPNAIWHAVPQGNSNFSHKFYGGITPLMTIRGDGNVGIGTETPAGKLDISSPTLSTNPEQDGILIKQDLDNQFLIQTYLDGQKTNQQITNYVTDANYPLSLQPLKGRVGIGTTAPAEKLHVEGNVLSNQYNFKGTGGNSGIAVNNYGIYQEAGAWADPFPDLNISYLTGIKLTGHSAYEGIRFYTGSAVNTGLAFQVGHPSDWVVSYKPLLTSGAYMYPANGDATGTPLQSTYFLRGHSDGIGTNNHFRVGGYLFSQYLNTTQPLDALSSYTVKSFPIRTSDDYIRMFSAADMRTALGLGAKPTFTGVGATAIALASTSSSTAALELTAPVNTTVHMSFHRPGQYATNFGLDVDGAFSFGGWSQGNAFAPIKTGNIASSGTITSGGFIYPGRADAPGTSQTSWYLGSRATHGLYTNTGLYAAGGILTGEWLRSTVASTGLYNNALANHFAAVSDADWRITGNASSCGLGFGSDNFSTIYGYTYGDAAGIGFLSPARGWAIRWLNNNTEITGNATSTGTMTATGFFQSSDARLKDVIKRDGDVAYYTWKDSRDKKVHIGYIAQEVQAKNPEQVNTDQDGKLSVNYIEILVEKIRNLEKEIELLKAKK